MNAKFTHLTAFQRDTLYIIPNLKTPYGLGIKAALQEYYGEEINQSRLYQNLGTLVERGYLEKRAIDDRSNSYTLTEKAMRAIEDRNRWQYRRVHNQIQAKDIRSSLWH